LKRTISSAFTLSLLLALLALLAADARALPPAPPGIGNGARTPAGAPASGPLQQVGYDQRLGEQVPLDLAFRDEAGRPVRLGSYFGKKPAILVLAYYECPMLCGMVLSGVTGSLKALSFDAGKEFDVIVVSIDPGETPQLAAEEKRNTLARYGRYGTDAGWHFLTGGQEEITRLTRAVGFRYAYDEERDEYAHAAGAVFLTPQGKVSRYLYGIEFAPKDVRLALVESAGGRIGSVIDQVLLYCFHYNPEMGRYSTMTLNILRIAAAATVLSLIALVLFLLRLERRAPRSVEAA
jgi:protein SCO1/2